MTTDLVAQHLGALHPVETAITLLLAFGPFVVLFVVIAVRRREDSRREATPDRPAGQEEPAVETGQRAK